MGEWGESVLDDIEGLYNEVEDWTVGAAYTIQHYAEDVADGLAPSMAYALVPPGTARGRCSVQVHAFIFSHAALR